MKKFGRASLLAASAALSVGIVAGTVDAAKGGGGNPKSSGPVIMVDDGAFASTTEARILTSAEPDALLITEATNTEFWVRGYCYQGGTMVWTQSGISSGGKLTFHLGPTPSWTSGSAECVAEHGFWRGTKWVPESSTTFTAHG